MENSNKNYQNYIVIGVAIIIAALIISYGIMNIKDTSRTITVKGYAELQITSDLAKWDLEVVGFHPNDKGEAYKIMQNNKKKALEYLKKNGISNEMIAEGSLNFNSEYDFVYGETSHQRFRGYSSRQILSITSNNVDKIKEISSKVNDLVLEGVDINSMPPQYFISDLNKYKVKMLGESLKDAKKRAVELADGVEDKIGGLKSARQGIFQITAVNSTDISDWGVYDVTSKEKVIKSVVDATFYIK